MSTNTERPEFGWTQWGDKRCHHPRISTERNIGTSANGRFLRGNVCPDCRTTFTVPRLPFAEVSP